MATTRMHKGQRRAQPKRPLQQPEHDGPEIHVLRGKIRDGVYTPIPGTMLNMQLNPRVYEHICALVNTGLFGDSPGEVAERLLCEQLRAVLKATYRPTPPLPPK